MAKKSLLAMGVVFLMILMTVSAWSAVPTSMNYQGRLTDPDGNPLTGTYEMTFFLLDAPSNGTIVWSENQPSVTVTDGIYNVQLGSVSNPFSPNLFVLYDELYLEVHIDSETLAPRQPVTSTAFSMKAAVAETVVDGGVTTVMIEDGAVDSQKLDNNAVTGTKIADGTVSYLDIQDGSTLEEIKDDDGANSGLDADKLDGLEASAFASSSHNHNSLYFTETESDSRFVNTTGDTISGSIAHPSAMLTVTNSGTGHGIHVSDAGFHGVSVSNAGLHGVSVSNPTYDGVYVNGSGDNGVEVYNSGDDGVVVSNAGSDGVYVSNATYDGVYVNGAETGVFVDDAQHGVVVWDVSANGVRVHNADWDGVRVDYAGSHGVRVEDTGDNGVEVNWAGNHGAYIYDPSVNGVEIYSPGFDGVHIINAARDGVRVSAADDGVQVSGAAYGLNATDMTTFGVYATGGTGAYFRDTGSGTYAYIAWGDYGIYSNGTKNFVQEHPTRSDQVIVYAALEGGEAGTYYRGTAQLANGAATIELPEHFTLVTEEEGLTVQVTPRADCNGLYVAKVDTSSIVVKELQGGTSNARFDFLVNGIRSGYADYKAINSKSELGLDEMEEAQREKEQKDAEQRAERERELEREQKQRQERERERQVEQEKRQKEEQRRERERQVEQEKRQKEEQRRELERQQRLEEQSRQVSKTG
jgi:hypothetical protein